MSHDYGALLYDPVYGELGVPATLVAAAMSAVNITVIDDTRSKTQISNTLETRSIGPGAFARIPELTAKGIMRTNYEGASLTFNGRDWIVRSYEIRGNPNGEDLGEVRFLLKAAP